VTLRTHLRLWWHRLWIRKDEFHRSLDMDCGAMLQMNPKQRQNYMSDLDNRIEQLQADKAELVEGLNRVDSFISGGIALGFIRMPDPKTPDVAHEVPPLVKALIAKHTGGEQQ